MEYKDSMKIKTSITVSQELLVDIDARASQSQRNRSDFIETALRIFIQQLEREERNAKDLEIINRRADYLNREAAEALTYQIPL
jgi:metal-responsive CopG/Arc/MetJ family transcriptional regulator